VHDVIHDINYTFVHFLSVEVVKCIEQLKMMLVHQFTITRNYYVMRRIFNTNL